MSASPVSTLLHSLDAEDARVIQEGGKAHLLFQLRSRPLHARHSLLARNTNRLEQHPALDLPVFRATPRDHEADSVMHLPQFLGSPAVIATVTGRSRLTRPAGDDSACAAAPHASTSARAHLKGWSKDA
ncbi:hypothetical protein HJC10_01500 [Corallococcus exiguus]|nr:hypothetical protein [Corallococcus exiguus]